MNTTDSPGWFSGRTKLVTMASVLAVGLAGAVAISANIGILNAAADTNVGSLSASVDTTAATTPQVVDVYVNDPTTTTSTPVAQDFAVDNAGIVSVAQDAAGLRVASVQANPGWTWSLAQSDLSSVAISFTDGSRTLVFHATSTDQGIAATVEETVVGQAAPAPAQPATTSHHSHDYEGHDDDD
ncbi:MAG: hypothetical protein R2705_05360 [Ilumatobacteraceae bacterium]